jgi:hypothetical protein
MDSIEKTNSYNFELDTNVEELFKKFFDSIPENATTSPAKITNYIKNKA